ncbi:MAG: hypothetical protein WA087_04135 [Candidatus Saccharimonadales bacterium]
MSSKQNNVDSKISDNKESGQPPEKTQSTGLESYFGSKKARAIVLLSTFVIGGGLMIYEKFSPKTDQPLPNPDPTTTEQGLVTPESSDNKSTPQPEKNDKYGNEIVINNYNEHVSDLPQDRKDALNSTLYNIVKNNLGSDNFDVNDATIRDGSAKNKYDEPTDINSGSFIVDMPSIKQSYLMTYKWTSKKNSSNLGGYTATAECLTPNKLAYGEFNCEDDFSKSKNNTERNPIMKHLPYSTFNYVISANTDKKGEVTLDVEIILYSADTRDGEREESIKKYKKEVEKWVESTGLDSNNYPINYKISE